MTEYEIGDIFSMSADSDFFVKLGPHPSSTTPGQIAYEIDCERKPNYHTGQTRKTWAELGEVERWDWERNPTPREYKTA